MSSRSPIRKCVRRNDVPAYLLNVRDLGGLPVGDGAVSRSGVLVRSDAPYGADRIEAQFEVWPPSDVVDLRSIGEAETEFDWPKSTTVHRFPLMADAAPGLQHGPLQAIYIEILNSLAARAGEFMALVADAQGPTLVHCAVGKDRTGVVVAVLLLAAGVDEDTVILDYQATRPTVSRVLDRIRVFGYDLPADFPPHLKDTPVQAIGAIIDILQSWPGGAAGWLVAHGADPSDLVRWQERFTGGDQLTSTRT